MIIPVWKKIGQSTHLLAKEVGGDQKATHTGTLDPMAEGVVVVLTGEDRFEKEKLAGGKKTYQFEILFGINTDSHDLLGLQTSVVEKTTTEDAVDKLSKLIPEFIGPQKQLQPAFSSQRIEGKSAFDLAKQGKEIDLKENDIDIYSLKILESERVELAKLKKEILEKLTLINGDFRQVEIIEQWNKTFDSLEENGVSKLPLIKLEAEVSKRTYIRSLVRDISKKMDLPATTYSIVRTKNAGFAIIPPYEQR